MNLSAENLRVLLQYDPVSGVFRWRKRTGKGAAQLTGKCAGHIANRRGGRRYVEIGVQGRLYLGHRLAWLYMTGKWPEHHIDHIDRDGTNNSWTNLREATNSENLFNRGKTQRNTSGFKGVWFHRKLQKWCAEIRADGKRYRLGTFTTPQIASQAYAEAAKRLHGKFARAA